MWVYPPDVPADPPDGDVDTRDVGFAQTEAAPTPHTPSGSSGAGRDAPSTVGRFRIDGPLGSGGMGDVFRAYDPVLDRAVALKVLRPGDGDEGSQRSRRVLREARAAASLSHPNAVTIFEVGEADGEVFIAMELLEGEDLRGVMDRGASTTSDKLRWLLDAARALAAAHERGLVHRDVKPENMFVCKGGTLKLLDFGIAKRGEDEPATGPPSDDGPGPSSLRTEEGRRIGTPRYMAPEQHFGHATDARTDQYAWGLVAFELLTGTHPSESQVTITKQDDRASPRTADACLAALEGLVADPIAKMIARTLEPLKEERFDAMADVVATLEAARDSAPSSSPEAEAAAPRQRKPRDPERDATTGPASDREPPASSAHAPPPTGRRTFAVAAIAVVAVVGAAAWAIRAAKTPAETVPVARVVEAPPSCTVVGHWTIPAVDEDRLAALHDGSVAVVRDFRRGLMLERVTRDGSTKPLISANPIAKFTDFEDVVMSGLQVGDEPAVASFITQVGRTPLVTLLQPGGGFSSSRLPVTVSGFDIDAVGGGVYFVTTSEAYSGIPGREGKLPPAARAHRLLPAPAKQVIIEDGVTTAPAIAAAPDKIAVAYQADGGIHAALLDTELTRAGDVMFVTPIQARPAVAFAGRTLVVLWAEDRAGKTRLMSAHLDAATGKFSAPAMARDEPLSPRSPVTTRLPDGRWTAAWIAARGGVTVVRAAVLGPDGELGAPTDIATAASFRGLSATATAKGLAMTWYDGKLVHVTEAACVSRE